MPACSPKPVVGLRRLERPVHRQRRGQQDRRVDARDQLRQLRARGRPLVAVHDPDEEVGREEGPEDHHLGDDEKQHAEQLRLDARGAVGLGRAVVVLVVDAGVAAVAPWLGWLTEAASIRLGRLFPGLDVLDRACRRSRWIFSTRPFSTHSERLEGSVETTTSEMWKYWSAFIAAV